MKPSEIPHPSDRPPGPSSPASNSRKAPRPVLGDYGDQTVPSRNKPKSRDIRRPPNTPGQPTEVIASDSADAHPQERPGSRTQTEHQEASTEGIQHQQHTESRREAHSQEEATRDITQRARARLNNAREELGRIGKQEWEQVTGRPASELEDLDARIGHAAAILDERSNVDPGQQPAQALALATDTSAALNEAADMAEAAASVAPHSLLAKAVNRILKFIEKAADWIVSLIARMTNPQQWTLQTNVRLPAFKAGITITFGERQPPSDPRASHTAPAQ